MQVVIKSTSIPFFLLSLYAQKVRIPPVFPLSYRYSLINPPFLLRGPLPRSPRPPRGQGFQFFICFYLGIYRIRQVHFSKNMCAPRNLRKPNDLSVAPKRDVKKIALIPILKPVCLQLFTTQLFRRLRKKLTLKKKTDNKTHISICFLHTLKF